MGNLKKKTATQRAKEAGMSYADYLRNSGPSFKSMESDEYKQIRVGQNDQFEADRRKRGG